MRSRERGRWSGMWDKGSFIDVEFDGKCRMIQVSNFVIVEVLMEVAIEMNWRPSKSTTPGTKN